MDGIVKSLARRHMTLFIIIRRVSSLGLTCFDGFLAGVILITNTPIIMSCVIIGNYVKPSAAASGFMMKNILRYASTNTTTPNKIGTGKEKHVSVNGLY
jgi:hypothetical protein